jgi:hypothetical protein
MDYIYEMSHYPNTVSWYRELVWLDDELAGEIRETTESHYGARQYEVAKYVPLKVLDGVVHIANICALFSTVSDCKDYINNGGIL